MVTRITYWPDESDTGFDVCLIEAVADHVGCIPVDLPPLGAKIDLDAITAIVQSTTPVSLEFHLTVPHQGAHPDGASETVLTVALDTAGDTPVHITVIDDSRGAGGLGATSRLW